MKKITIYIFFMSLMIINLFNTVSYPADKTDLRIATLSPNLTEICISLGLGDKIVCTTHDCDYKKNNSPIPKLNPKGSLEELNSYSPNLIIADKFTNPSQILKNYIEAGLNVKITSNDNLDEIYNTISIIGSWTNTSDEAIKLIAKMKAQINDIKKLLPEKTDKKVLLVIKGRTLIVCRSGSLQNSLIGLSGAKNITDGTQLEKNTQRYIKTLMQDNPDTIIELLKKPKTEITESYQRWGLFKDAKAIKTKQLYILPSETLLVAGPNITEGFAIMCAAIYPEKKDVISKYIQENFK